MWIIHIILELKFCEEHVSMHKAYPNDFTQLVSAEFWVSYTKHTHTHTCILEWRLAMHLFLSCTSFHCKSTFAIFYSWCRKVLRSGGSSRILASATIARCLLVYSVPMLTLRALIWKKFSFAIIPLTDCLFFIFIKFSSCVFGIRNEKCARWKEWKMCVSTTLSCNPYSFS